MLVSILVCKMLYFCIHIPEDTTRLRRHEVLCHVKILEFSCMGFIINNYFYKREKRNPKLSFSLPQTGSLSLPPIKPLPVTVHHRTRSFRPLLRPVRGPRCSTNSGHPFSAQNQRRTELEQRERPQQFGRLPLDFAADLAF